MASATITGEDQWTDPIRIGPATAGGFSIRGTSWVANVELVRRPIGGTEWETVPQGVYTANTEKRIAPSGAYEYRLGVPVANYTSGTITVEIRGSQ